MSGTIRNIMHPSDTMIKFTSLIVSENSQNWCVNLKTLVTFSRILRDHMMHIMMEALAVRTIFTSAMSKSTSFWRKISICSLNFSWTTFFPAPLEYSEAVWQIDPAKSTPPSWATPLARSHAAWFILVVWNKISKQYFYRLFFFLVGGGRESKSWFYNCVSWGKSKNKV